MKSLRLDLKQGISYLERERGRGRERERGRGRERERERHKEREGERADNKNHEQCRVVQLVYNDNVFNFFRFERVLSAAQAAKVIIKKLKPEDLKLLEATLNASAEGITMLRKYISILVYPKLTYN